MNRKLITLLLALMVTFGVSAQSFTAKKKVANATNSKGMLTELIQSIKVETPSNYSFVPSITGQKGKAALNEGFESTTFPPDGWTVINGGDPNTWVRYTSTPNTGAACAAISYNSAAHDDYLITPKLVVTSTDTLLKAWFKSYNSTYPEPYDVMVSTTGTNPGDFTLLVAEGDPGTTWIEKTYNLSAYAGQNVYVAFRSTTTDQWRLYIDDVTGPEIFLAADDAGVVSIDVPSAFSPDTVTPKATVKNFGSVAQDFKVFFEVKKYGSVIYNDSTDVTALASGATLQVNFDDVIVDTGSYVTKVYIVNDGDLDNTNDMLTKNVEVKVFNWAYAISAGTNPVKFALNDPSTVVTLATPGGSTFIRSGAWANGKWYAAINTTHNLLTIDTETGVQTVVGPMTEAPNGMSYDITTSTMYGVNATDLYTIDLATGTRTLVGSMGVASSLFINLACDVNGNLYSVNIADDKLYSINKTTGAATEIGAIGFDANYGQDMEFDNYNNILYYAATHASSELFTVDVTTGACTSVGALPAQFSGMAIPFTPSGATITFTINDGTNPIEGANIAIGTANLLTNASGVASSFLLEGKHYITVSKFGYENKLDSITVVNGVADSKTISLTALTAFDVTFTVKNNIPANLAGATVTIKNGANTVATGTTDANGVYTATAVPVGNYTYDVTLDGYIAQTAQALVVDGVEAVDVILLEDIQTPFGLQWTSDGLPEGDVLFSWNNVQEFVDDFDTYEDFVLTFGNWTLNDVDGAATYGFNGATFTNSGAPMAGIIFNPSQVAPAITTSPAHSGDKYVATFNPGDASACNDWIISPKTMVAPNGQVSFWARGGNAQYSAEVFQVFVSTTNTDPASFTSISPVVTCAAGSVDWVEYTYSLSAYTGQEVYVGIHVTSVDQFYFCLDDFRIGPATKNAKAVTGYNVYLDNTTTPVASNVAGTSYTFNSVTPGAHTAYVEGVYATGVSTKAELAFVYVGLGENNKPSYVSVFPNPAKNVINVNATNNIISVKVVNILGAQVINEKVDATKANINISNLESGMYYISVETANGVSTQKINVVK